MQWIITKCYFELPSSPGQHYGPSKLQDIPIQEKGKFRLLDDDNEPMFFGFMNQIQFDNADGNEVFEPLNYMSQDYGCTQMQYWNKEWCVL